MPKALFETLENPPIHEAVLDVRVRARPDLLLDDVLGLAEGMATLFPKSDRMRTMQATIRLDAKGSQTEHSESREVGVVMRSADGKLVLQLRVDGVTLSRLAPYRSFDELEPLLASCWSAYVESVRPEAIVRTAVRYINRFEIASQGDLREWISAPPGPPADELTISSYQHRELWRTGGEGFGVVLTTALEPSLSGHSRQVVVDIDVFSEAVFEAVASSPAKASLAWVRSNLVELRNVKNRVFFNSLTDRCLQSFR